MKVYNYVLEANQPMNTSFATKSMQLNHMFGYSVQIEFSGTPNGTFKLQASCDPLPLPNQPDAPYPINWSDITESIKTFTASGDFTWNVYDVMYNYVRLVYTANSTGTSNAVLVKAILNGKGW